MKIMASISLKMLLLAAIIAITLTAKAQAPAIQWQKCIGGSASEQGFSIQLCSDGGYILAGSSQSIDSNIIGNHGASDYLIVKLDSIGTTQWQKCLGGSGFDVAQSIQQCSDGGYIVAGDSYSYDGDITNNHSYGYDDYWVVKLDTSGTIQWQKSLGGSFNDYAYSIQQCTDGGYIVAGSSNSVNGDVTTHHNDSTTSDYWIVKLDAAGEIQWQKSFGGSDNDEALSIQQCNDGGYIVAGFSQSTDGDVTGNHGGHGDFWILKLDATGTLIWQKCLGGSLGDVAFSIQQCSDGGYIAAGYTYSSNLNVSGNFGGDDYWVVKLSATGSLQWQKCLGGGDADFAYSVQQCADGGFIVAGSSGSIDDEVTGNNGSQDYWVAKLDVSGNLQWQKCLGGISSDVARSIQQCTDGGYILFGTSNSPNGDVTGNHGNGDYWVVKLAASITPTSIAPISATQQVNIYPNPAKGLLTVKLTDKNPRTFTITDIEGRIIKTVYITVNNSTIDISNLANGIYLLQHNDGLRSIADKFIINN